jgi:hypothetical protein
VKDHSKQKPSYLDLLAEVKRLRGENECLRGYAEQSKEFQRIAEDEVERLRATLQAIIDRADRTKTDWPVGWGAAAIARQALEGEK